MADSVGAGGGEGVETGVSADLWVLVAGISEMKLNKDHAQIQNIKSKHLKTGYKNKESKIKITMSRGRRQLCRNIRAERQDNSSSLHPYCGSMLAACHVSAMSSDFWDRVGSFAWITQFADAAFIIFARERGNCM